MQLYYKAVFVVVVAIVVVVYGADVDVVLFVEIRLHGLKIAEVAATVLILPSGRQFIPMAHTKISFFLSNH